MRVVVGDADERPETHGRVERLDVDAQRVDAAQREELSDFELNGGRLHRTDCRLYRLG